MRKTLVWALGALLFGASLGVALGYVEARAWRIGFNAASPALPPSADETSSKREDSTKLIVEEEQYNFGNMEIGTTQRHTFHFKNGGDAPITVTFLSNTCQCTSVKLGGQEAEKGVYVVIPSGETKTAELEWIAKGEPREFRHGATFSTTDPAYKRLELTVVGELVESTSLEPSFLDFGTIRVGESSEASLIISSNVQPEIEVLDHRVLDEKLAARTKVRLEPLSPLELPNPAAQAGVRVVATVQSGDALGPFHGMLEIETNIDQASRLSVPLSGNVIGDISLYGPGWNRHAGLLKLPVIDGKVGGSVKLNIAVRGEYAAETNIEVASTAPEVLHATVGKPREMSPKLMHIPLTVEIPAGTRPMIHQGVDHADDGEIVLRTTHPETPEVRMRVEFIVQ